MIFYGLLIADTPFTESLSHPHTHIHTHRHHTNRHKVWGGGYRMKKEGFHEVASERWGVWEQK